MTNSKRIEAMIADSLGQEHVLELTDEVLEVQTLAESIAGNRQYYKPMRDMGAGKLLIANCSNSNCSVHIALNPAKVNLVGISLSCKVCNSPMKLAKDR